MELREHTEYGLQPVREYYRVRADINLDAVYQNIKERVSQ